MKRISLSLAVLVMITGAADAQTAGPQPKNQESAPAESSHAPGHDVQTGAPQSADTAQGKLKASPKEADRKDAEAPKVQPNAPTARQ